MTEPHNESLPFADTDEFEGETKSTIERLLTGAFEAKTIDEVTYRRLSASVHEVDGNVFDYFVRLLDEFMEAGEAALLDRIMKGAEFIDSLSPDDHRREKAVKKYDTLCEQFQNQRDWREDFAQRYEYDPPNRKADGERKEPA